MLKNKIVIQMFFEKVIAKNENREVIAIKNTANTTRVFFEK